MDVDKTIIEATIQDLGQVRDNLLGQRTELDDRLSKLNNRINQWQVQLIQATNSDESKTPVKRRKKGKNLKTVERVFRENLSEDGLTIREVSDLSEVPWSSARNVLQKHKDKYEKREGRWYRRTEVQKVDI